MSTLSVNPDALERLPAAIWLPRGKGSVVIYRGSPLEIVRTMAAEMGEGVTIRQAVRKLLVKLTEDRRIGIELPEGLPEDRLAKLFIHALLKTGLGREMAKA